MGAFYWEPSWPERIAKQEALLRYETFTRDTALSLGLSIRELVGDVYHGGAAIRILEDGLVIFSCKMDGSSGENDWWMDRKLAVSRVTGTSSLRAYVEAEAGLREAFWTARPDNFAACGGCIPVFPMDGSAPTCHVLVSGLQHQEDHQVIADAMARQLGVAIPSLL